MDPQDRVLELLREHNFDLVRQRKHKIFKNPEGVMFVVASTPSDWRASLNSLSTLKRILRRDQGDDSATGIVGPGQQLPPLRVESECAAQDGSEVETEDPAGCSTAVTQAPPHVDPEPQKPMSELEWETWKRRYWREERLLLKNEKFLSIVSKYVARLSQLIQRGDIAASSATDGLKAILREMQYRSKVLVYDCKFFDKGVVVFEGIDQPILWASNGHIGISSFLYFGSYVQHQPVKLQQIRFVWDGLPVIFERPEAGSRKFAIRVGNSLALSEPE